MDDTREKNCLFLLLKINLENRKHTHKSELTYRRVISRIKAKFKRRLFVCNKWNRLYILSASHTCLIDQDLRAIRSLRIAFLSSSAVLQTLGQMTSSSAESVWADTRGHHSVWVLEKTFRIRLNQVFSQVQGSGLTELVQGPLGSSCLKDMWMYVRLQWNQKLLKMHVFLLVPWEVTCKKIKDKINGLLAGTHTGTCPLSPLLRVATPACLLRQHHLSHSGDQKRRKQKGSLVKRRRCEETF